MQTSARSQAANKQARGGKIRRVKIPTKSDIRFSAGIKQKMSGPERWEEKKKNGWRPEEKYNTSSWYVVSFWEEHLPLTLPFFYCLNVNFSIWNLILSVN